MLVLYIVCFICYVFFSRVPDYFEAELVNGVVTRAAFSADDKHPVLTVQYRVGEDEFEYATNRWYLSSHKEGQKVPIIYNPSDPATASIYSFIGYWVTLKELFFTALVFVTLFIMAIMITGKSNGTLLEAESKKRKYLD